MNFEERDQNNNRPQKEDPINIGKPKLMDDLLSMENNNKKVLFLIQELEKYKKEKASLIHARKPMENKSFKENLFESLEKLLIQISYLEKKEIRQEKIDKLYQWYTRKKTSYFSIINIKHKSYYEKEEIPDKEITQNNSKVNSDEEVIHRTNLGVGKIIKDYKIKKVKVNTRKSIPNSKDDYKENLQFAKDSMINFNLQNSKSTFYTSKNSMNFYAKMSTRQTFFDKNNKENNNLVEDNIIPTKEVKASYSYLRPPYQFNILDLEKTIFNQKNKLLIEKRAQEEIKHALNDFGVKRALYKGRMNKINETKKVVDLYTSLQIEREKRKEENNINDIPPDISPHTSTNNSNIKTKFIQRSNSQYNTSVNNKVVANTIQNIESKYKIDNNINKEKEYSLSFKLSHSRSQENVLQNHKENFEIPMDSVYLYKSNDPIYQARLKNKTLLKVKEIDNPNKGYSAHYTPLSAFDIKNYNLMNLNKNNSLSCRSNNDTTANLNNTSYIYAKKNFANNKNNYLNLRKTIGSFKINEYHSLRKSVDNIRKKRKLDDSDTNVSSINKSSLYEAFSSPKEDSTFPQFFLPRSGSGLLSKPEGIY